MGCGNAGSGKGPEPGARAARCATRFDALEPSGGQLAAAARTTGAKHLAATDSSHTRAETVTPLAHEIAGLESALHRLPLVNFLHRPAKGKTARTKRAATQATAIRARG